MIKPYYKKGDVTLYCADCMELDAPCDLLITDPPYGKDFKSNRGKTFERIKGDKRNQQVEVVARLAHAMKSLRPFRHVYIFEESFDLSSLPLAGLCELIWDKANIGLGDLTLPWGPQHEKIRFGVYVPSKANRERGDGALAARLRKGSILRSLRANSRGAKHHPTEKPVDILRQMIESSSVMGEVVYDPFAGSGSTLIAAALEGRSAIGCEIDEKHCEAAAKRMEKEL